MNLKIKTIESKIKIPATKWHGRCHEIAGKILEAKIVKGKLRYGTWLGPIAEGSYFKNHLNHHGWIEDGETIIDPTRWVFENVDPYIFVGKDEDGYYDLASQKTRQAFSSPRPQFDNSAEVKFSVSKEVCKFVRSLLDHPYITKSGLFWIANLPIDTLEPHTKEIYQALEKLKMQAFVPFDCWDIVMGEHS